jgi:hypothetical protein
MPKPVVYENRPASGKSRAECQLNFEPHLCTPIKIFKFLPARVVGNNPYKPGATPVIKEKTTGENQEEH